MIFFVSFIFLYVVFDSYMHIPDLSLEQLLKTYFDHHDFQRSIQHLWTTSSSQTHYQYFSLKQFLLKGSPRVSDISTCGEHY